MCFPNNTGQAGNEAKRVSKQILVPNYIKDISLDSSGLLVFGSILRNSFIPLVYVFRSINFELLQIPHLSITFAVSSYVYFKIKQRF